MTDNILEAWLNGDHLGELERLRNGRLRFRPATEAIDRYGENSLALSLSVPLRSGRTQGPELERFVEGLLPESSVRAMIERENHVNPHDSFALLRAIGAECAGAIQFTPAGSPPPNGFLRPLTDDEVNALVRGLPTLTPPDGLPITASLGGVQAKILLSRSDGRWAWPAAGAMSTHLIKPQSLLDSTLPHLIESEEWALRLARTIGIPAASAEVLDFDGRRAIVVERFDRLRGSRQHQEDFAQALGYAPSDKYEAPLGGQRRLLTIAGRAGRASQDQRGFRLKLLRQLAFNTIIGNGDAHSKNYSLTISRQGVFDLSPLYDVAPVFLMNPVYSHSGHALSGQTDLKYITADHLIDEATAWGIPEAAAAQTIDEVSTALADAVREIDTDESISELPELVGRRAARFRRAPAGA